MECLGCGAEVAPGTRWCENCDIAGSSRAGLPTPPPPVTEPAPAVIAPTPWAYPTSTPVAPPPFPPAGEYAQPFPPPRRGRNISVGLAVAAWIVLVAVAGLGAFLLLHNSKSKPDTSSSVTLPNDAPAAAGLPPGYAEFVDRADAFRIAVPSAWRQINLSSPGAVQAFQQLVQSNPRLGAVFGSNAASLIARHIKFLAIDLNFHGLSPNVNITVVPAIGIRDADLAENLAGIRKGYNRLGITILHSEPAQVAGHQALQLTVQLGADANATHAPLTETQYLVGANDLIYTITFTGISSDFRAIVATFRTS
jgi:hypothetical protein